MPEQQIRVEYQLSTKTAFHIGTGNTEGLLDRTMVKDGFGCLSIPASSIKGVLRSKVRSLANAWGLPNCGSNYGSVWCFKSQNCLVCNLFGSTFSGERLFFADCGLTEESRRVFSIGPEELPFGQTQIRTQIKINRRSGVAEEGHLFTSEYGNPGLVFQSVITGKINSAAMVSGETKFLPELIILLVGLKTLARIGAGRSRGNGGITLDLLGLWVNREEVDINSQLKLLPDAVSALRERRVGR